MGIMLYYFEPKHQCSSTVKKVLYVNFFDKKGPVVQLPVPKGKMVTAAFYRNVVLKKRSHTKTGLKFLSLVHDNAPTHKSHIVTKFLESKKVNVHQYPPFSPDLAPCDYFCFPNSNSVRLEKDICQEILCYKSVPHVCANLGL